MRSTLFYRKRLRHKQCNEEHCKQRNTRCNKERQRNRNRPKHTANSRADHKPKANSTAEVAKPFTSFMRFCTVGYIGKQCTLISCTEPINDSSEKEYPKCAANTEQQISYNRTK